MGAIEEWVEVAKEPLKQEEDDGPLSFFKGAGSRAIDLVTAPYTILKAGYEGAKYLKEGGELPSLKTVGETAPGIAGTMLVGPNLMDAWREGSLEPAFGTWEKAGETVFDILMAKQNPALALGAASKMGHAARAGSLGKTVQRGAEAVGKVTDPLVAKVVPKFMHTPKMEEIVNQRLGGEFAGIVGSARPGMESTKKLGGQTHLVDPSLPGQAGAMALATPAERQLAKSIRYDIDKLRDVQHSQGIVSTAAYNKDFGIHLAPERVPGEAYTTRVGKTLADLTSSLAMNKALERLTLTTAYDGRASVLTKAHLGNNLDYVPLDPKIAGAKWKDAYLHPDIEDAFRAFDAEAVTGWAQSYYKLWKVTKVVGNVPTHINNLVGDAIFSVLAGNSVFNPRNMPYYTKAMKDITAFVRNPNNITPELLDSIRGGSTLPSFATLEAGYTYANIKPSMAKNPMERIVESIVNSTPGRVALRTYDAEDQVFRYATYLKNLYGKKMSSVAANAGVNDFYPNYAVTSKLGRFGRGEEGFAGAPAGIGPAVTGPFISFPLETMRIYNNAATKHPYRYAAALSIPMAWQLSGSVAQGMTPEEFSSFLRNRPEHQKDRVLVPFPAPDGGFMDVTPFFPLADPQTQDYFFGGLGGAIAGLVANKDLRTGQPLYDERLGFTDVFTAALDKLSPEPSMVSSFRRRGRAADAGAQYRSFPSGHLEDPEKVTARSLFPTLEARPMAELSEGAEKQRTGDIRGAKGAVKGTARKRTLGEIEKEEKKGALREYIDSVHERQR